MKAVIAEPGLGTMLNKIWHRLSGQVTPASVFAA